ncbi:hypothetical protein [Streptomyces violascens]|uniref:Integral membrane protein n=1 Tax=Streptomyces violascens TaxID=67381 RepID=A0ABQ3QJU1_9ACTN|nr:hypothetical protein [Streptomyces violascens]GGT95072.1 hypothetical protein GCM10010289_14060 [Streptomyces violascens]GHI37545.1 hypothetical protein Sviol_19530 [Streptomyces violascens]
MGWTVLYIAFAIVALWLLGEVLLQYKARLRWRLLAFTGFVGVVLGVLIPSVFVIILGAIAFAVGQVYVTLSFRRGFSTGWALGGRPGASRRRRASRGKSAPAPEPVLEVSDLQYEDVSAAGSPDENGEMPHAGPGHGDSVYEPQPMPDETGQYGIYSPAQQPEAQYPAYDPQQPYADPYAPQYDEPGAGQQQYAAYSDPYIGNGGQAYGTYNGYDSFGGQQSYPADPLTAQYATDTPPGGVWVPQQRDGEYVPYEQQQPQEPQQPGQQPYDPNHPDLPHYPEQQPYRY